MMFLRAAIVVFVACTVTIADPIRAYDVGELPNDKRLGALHHLDAYHPFRHVPADQWEERAEHIRNRVKLAAGLWPMPTRTPLNVRVHGRVERDDFTVDRVIIESYPGHFVTGSLFMPKNPPAKMPGVLCPHGHWRNGRFYDAGEAGAKAQIAIGAERFLEGGRSPLQARCVQLARMGCMVFFYDMIGNADSIQFLDHRPGVRDHMNSGKLGEFGFCSAQADLRLQTHFGLQTWNSVRALDFLLSQQGVDPERIGVTGASGGATQTMMITAVDDRIKLAFPAVMVSTAMQGGCTCENSHYLRNGVGNIDIAAITAPRPLGLTAADDWTIELKTKGYPDLKSLYERLGVKDRFVTTFNIHFKHNYNHVSRSTMYAFVNKHFKLGLSDVVLEREFDRLTTDELTVWTGKHVKPSGDQVGDTHERSLHTHMANDSDAIMRSLTPSDSTSMKKFHDVVGAAYDIIVDRDLPGADEVTGELIDKQQRDGYLLMSLRVRNKSHQEELPAVFFYPADNWNSDVVLWVHPEGKSSAFQGNEPNAAIARLIKQGFAVAAVDLMYQGEFLKDGEPVSRTRQNSYRSLDRPWAKFSGYTYGYNHPVFVKRAHDVMTMVAFIKNHRRSPKRILVAGIDGGGRWVALAATKFGDAVDRSIIDTAGFRFQDLSRTDHPDFLPGSVKYADIAGILALTVGHEVYLSGEKRIPQVYQAALKATGTRDRVTVSSGSLKTLTRQAADWLTR